MAYMAANCAKLSNGIILMIAKMNMFHIRQLLKPAVLPSCWNDCFATKTVIFSIFFEERQKYAKGPFSWTVSVDETELKQ